MAKKYRTDGTSTYSIRPMPGSTTSPELEQLKKKKFNKKENNIYTYALKDITILWHYR